MKAKLMIFSLLATLTLREGLFAVSSNGRLVGKSDKNRVQMLELYSSESCSSCPPADRWVSTLKDNPRLWKEFIPVVFHVDYWNHLNWKDNLSSEAMTKRQVDLSKQWPRPSVYTPGVVLDGLEWTEWSRGQIPNIKGTMAPELSLTEINPEEFLVETSANVSNSKKYNVRVAILGFGLESKVTSGENGGQLLKHDFVVLSWDGKILSSDTKKLIFKLKKPTQKYSKLAAVTWIEEVGNLTPIQVAGGYL